MAWRMALPGTVQVQADPGVPAPGAGQQFVDSPGLYRLSAIVQNGCQLIGRQGHLRGAQLE
ncbi:hypothetical protein D3C75_1361000 [compost metagenome]